MQWYLKSAEQGCKEAQFILGEINLPDFSGYGQWKWYSEAALQGHSGAEFKLGEICRTGEMMWKHANGIGDRQSMETSGLSTSWPCVFKMERVQKRIYLRGWGGT